MYAREVRCQTDRRQTTYRFMLRLLGAGHNNVYCSDSECQQTAFSLTIIVIDRQRVTTASTSAPFLTLVRLRGTDYLKSFAQHLTSQTFGSFSKLTRKCTLWRCKSTPTPKAKLLWMTSHYGPTVVRSVTEIPFHVFI